MENPCMMCLVRAVCQNECEEFIKFIVSEFRPNRYKGIEPLDIILPKETATYVALQIRLGRFHIKGNAIRRISDGKPMLTMYSKSDVQR